MKGMRKNTGMGKEAKNTARRVVDSVPIKTVGSELLEKFLE